MQTPLHLKSSDGISNKWKWSRVLSVTCINLHFYLFWLAYPSVFFPSTRALVHINCLVFAPLIIMSKPCSHHVPLCPWMIPNSPPLFQLRFWNLESPMQLAHSYWGIVNALHSILCHFLSRTLGTRETRDKTTFRPHTRSLSLKT